MRLTRQKNIAMKHLKMKSEKLYSVLSIAIFVIAFF